MKTHVYADYETLCQNAAEQIRTMVRTVLTTQDAFAFALSGGDTPRRLYERLSEMPLPWEQIHLFWGDDRMVPYDHPESNVRLVRETLLRDVDLPDENIHPMPTSSPGDQAASTYADTLQSAFADRPHTFDLSLLGMGEDGHTASLFPEHDPDPNDAKWVRAVSAPPPHKITDRLTCTLPVLNASQHAMVLVSGASKRETLKTVLQRDKRLPISKIRPRSPLTWLLDAAADPSSRSD